MRIPTKKWVAIVVDGKRETLTRVPVDDNVDFVSDFTDAAMLAPAFQSRLLPYGTTLQIHVKRGDEVQVLGMDAPVSTLEAFGNNSATAIEIVLPSVPGIICPAALNFLKSDEKHCRFKPSSVKRKYSDCSTAAGFVHCHLHRAISVLPRKSDSGINLSKCPYSCSGFSAKC